MTECAWCGEFVSPQRADRHNGDPCHSDCKPFLERAEKIEQRGLSFEGVL